MDSSPIPVVPVDTPASCAEGCHFAEPLHGDYEDWMWCNRPGMLSRVRRAGSDCPALRASPRSQIIEQLATELSG